MIYKYLSICENTLATSPTDLVSIVDLRQVLTCLVP